MGGQGIEAAGALPARARPAAAHGPVAAGAAVSGPTLAILAGLSLSRLLNDLVPSLLPAIYPLLKDRFALDFGQIGLITFVFRVTASILQPIVGFGMGGLGAALLGEVADRTGIEFVYGLCAYLPLIGLLAIFLPRLRPAA